MKIKDLFRFLFLIVIFPLILVSCSKDRDDELSLFGNWVEEAPVPERTQIYFFPGKEISISYSDGTREEYYYEIDGESIYLSTERYTEKEDAPIELFFKQIDENTFQIADLYVSIPEMEPTFIIFEREVL